MSSHYFYGLLILRIKWLNDQNTQIGDVLNHDFPSRFIIYFFLWLLIVYFGLFWLSEMANSEDDIWTPLFEKGLRVWACSFWSSAMWGHKKKAITRHQNQTLTLSIPDAKTKK